MNTSVASDKTKTLIIKHVKHSTHHKLRIIAAVEDVQLAKALELVMDFYLENEGK